MSMISADAKNPYKISVCSMLPLRILKNWKVNDHKLKSFASSRRECSSGVAIAVYIVSGWGMKTTQLLHHYTDSIPVQTADTQMNTISRRVLCSDNGKEENTQGRTSMNVQPPSVVLLTSVKWRSAVPLLNVRDVAQTDLFWHSLFFYAEITDRGVKKLESWMKNKILCF